MSSVLHTESSVWIVKPDANSNGNGARVVVQDRSIYMDEGPSIQRLQATGARTFGARVDSAGDKIPIIGFRVTLLTTLNGSSVRRLARKGTDLAGLAAEWFDLYAAANETARWEEEGLPVLSGEANVDKVYSITLTNEGATDCEFEVAIVYGTPA